jgi:transcriptional regulator with XRE-family HTH domain
MTQTAHFSEVIKIYRKRKGYTQLEAAHTMGYSVETIKAWESEKRYPAPDRIPHLAALLEIDSQFLTEAINVSRTESYIQKSLRKPDRKQADELNEAAILDQAETITSLAWDAWFAAQPGQAAREVYRLLPELDQMYRTATPSDHILRIRNLLIRSHELLGTIQLDAMQRNIGLYHYSQAHCLAIEARDIDKAAIYAALIGDARRQDDKEKATRIIEEALVQATNAQKTTRGNILQLLAFTYADTGHPSEFERTINEATDLLSISGEGKVVAHKEFHPFELYEIRGKGSRDLGNPVEALRYLELAEQSLHTEAVPPRWYALLDISKAQAYCDLDNMQDGITLASRGFLRAYQCHSLRQMHRVRKLLRKLESGLHQGDRLVKELHELLYETYAKLELEG